jgi:hypothetical protein
MEGLSAYCAICFRHIVLILLSVQKAGNPDWNFPKTLQASRIGWGGKLQFGGDVQGKSGQKRRQKGKIPGTKIEKCSHLEGEVDAVSIVH